MEASTVPVKAPVERRPLAELLPVGRDRTVTAVLGVALAVGSVADFGLSGRALVGVVLCPTLVLLSTIDIRHRLLPNAVIGPAILAVALIVAAADTAGFLEHLYAALALFGFLFVFALAVPSGLGMGDAKLGFLLGIALGYRTLSAMLAAFAGSFVAALWILFRGGIAARRQTFPFGPYLAAGGILAFFLG